MLWARIVSSFQLSRPLLKSFRASKSQKKSCQSGTLLTFREGQLTPLTPLVVPLTGHISKVGPSFIFGLRFR